MANLGLAGAISGMGQGLERGLQQIQGGLIQHGLQESDRKFQSEKLKLQMDHATKLQEGTIAANREEGKATRDAHAANTDKTIAAQKEIEGWRVQVDEGKHADLMKLKKDELSLAQQKLDNEKEAEAHKNAYYQAYAGYLNRRDANPLSDKDKGRIQYFNNQLSSLQKTKERLLVEKFKDPDKLGLDPEKSKERAAAIDAEIAKIHKDMTSVSLQGLKILGIEPPQSTEPLESEEEFNVPLHLKSRNAQPGGGSPLGARPTAPPDKWAGTPPPQSAGPSGIIIEPRRPR